MKVRGSAVLGGDEGDVDFVELVHESFVVGEEGEGAIVVLVDDAVVGGFLCPFVDETSGEDGHLGAVEDGDFVKDSR